MLSGDGGCGDLLVVASLLTLCFLIKQSGISIH